MIYEGKQMIELYTDATPNGLKISIALEELGLVYKANKIYLGGDQKTGEFTKMNPNQKIPVLKDGDLIVAESGAILFYLAEKTGKLLPEGLNARTKVMELLMLQMSGFGPSFGQLMVWAGAWNNEYPKATDRYHRETIRLLGVLEVLLEGSRYFAGDEYSIADIAFYPWVRMCFVHPVGEMLPMNKFKLVSNWYQNISQRKAVQAGLLVPEPHPPEEQFKAFVSAVVGLGELH